MKIRKQLSKFIIFFSVYLLPATAADICSRVAVINYQDVLVDSTTTAKGEGLRPYLAQDAKANQLLDEYQSLNRPSWGVTGLSTVGAMALLWGFLSNNDQKDSLTNKNNLIIGGLVTIAVSTLINKTNMHNSEFVLLQAVEEYNKRNRPTIFFSPFADQSDSTNFGLGIGVGVQKDF